MLCNEQLVALAPWLKWMFCHDFFCNGSSRTNCFDNLPLLFAVGTALGLAGGDGVAALAALVGYLIMNATMGQVMHITIDDIYGYANGAKELSQANKLPANAFNFRYSNITNRRFWWDYHGGACSLVL